MKTKTSDINQIASQNNPIIAAAPTTYWVLLLIAAIGLADASYLSWVHLSVSKTCGVGQGCSIVLASPWAVVAGIPVAALGAGMYLALAWFAVQIVFKHETLPANGPWMLAISAAGVGFSAFFAALQAWVIREWCPLCLLSAGLITAFFLICLRDCLKNGSPRAAVGQPRLLYGGLPWALLALVLPPLIVLNAQAGRGAHSSGSSGSDGQVAGVIGEKTYTLDDVDTAIRAKLQQLDEQRYRLRKAFLDEKLLDLEASRQGLTSRALLKQEVLDKISVTTEEIEQFVRDNRMRPLGKHDRKQRRSIQNWIRKKKVKAARADYIGRLKEKHAIRTSLPLPTRLSIETNPRGGPQMGPADAPVSIVIFTDLQCPYCSRAHQELHKLMDRFPGKIRLAFRHFPLARHKWARRAAEYAYCTQQQGHFWPFVDAVFEHHGGFSEDVLDAYAQQSGIGDRAAFDQCLQGDAAKKAVADDIAEGEELGISSTPSFFVNGRFFSGLPGDLDAVIQAEINREKAS